MLPHSFGSFGPSVLLDFKTYRGFVFVKAVTDHSLSERLLLPYRNAQVSRRECLSGVVEVDHVTTGVGAKAVVLPRKPPKRLFGQQRLHGQQVHSDTRGGASWTSQRDRAGRCFGWRTAAPLLHAIDYPL